MKLKGTILIILLFLLIGAVSASDDFNDTLSINATDAPILSEENTVNLTQNADTDDCEVLQENNTTTNELSDPQITVSSVSGQAGKTITLKAIVKTENGSAENATVTFHLNGNTYTATTNSNGVATVKVICPPASAKTTSKTKGNVLTKTTTYKSTYTCNVTASGETYNTGNASFSVISTKAKVVKKYKIIKKKITKTIKIKNGANIYKWGNYQFVVYKHKKSPYTFVETAGVGKKEGNLIPFQIKHHFKSGGKWRWESWHKVSKGNHYTLYYKKQFQCDKLQVKYTR